MEDYSGLADFKLHLIETITDNFSDEKKVGSGVYGDVYKAVHDGKEIAVKKLHPFQGLDDRQFHSEVRNLVNVHHKNVVRLIGYCYEIRKKYITHNKELVFANVMERVICFEFMQGGSLDQHITDKPCGLGWSTCYDIIKGTCEGLNHLHSAREKPIYHMDLKPGNILLDESMMPKIGDLGLSKLVASPETYETGMLKRTNWYMPPEYIDNGYVSKKFDVFSLGVIILRMMAGNKGYFSCSTTPPKQFIDRVSENWKERLQEASKDSSPDMDILSIFRVRKCVEIALRCVDTDRKRRPTIQYIVRQLEELESEIKKIMSAPSAQVVQDDEEDRPVSLLGGTKRIMDFDLHTIETITNNFSEEQKVGSGGYGNVYEAFHEGEVLAVKKLHHLQGLDDTRFKSEFHNLSNVRHQNVVRLISYCYESRSTLSKKNDGGLFFMETKERVLCFEFMHGGSLDKHIQDESCGLEWLTCYKIIKGTCDGLNHLHNSQGQPIFHLDLKPGNILLDKSMTPKIGDLGLSTFIASTKTRQTEMRDVTLGFIPPEYVASSYISKKFDVFSLGVIIIKILAGNKGYYSCSEMSPEQFIELVSENWTKRLQTMMRDSSLQEDILRVRTCVKIALRCVHKDRKKRPSIKDIVHELEELEANITIMSHLIPQTGSKPRHMSFQHLKDITENFSEDRILGSGGFGVVYKGSMKNGEVVAVKKLVQSTLKSQKQFENEVDLLMTLKHQNVVRLLGYCYETQLLNMPYEGKIVPAQHIERLLCLECMAGSLDKYIKDVSSGHDWHTRYKIIEGISFGLQYLHEESNGPIIHLDLKPANILLDESLVPKITDFGLSRLFDNNQTISTATSSGTLGYMALEYQLRGIITPMADIFSLGVIIMEVITGHKDYPYDIRTSSKDFIKHELEEWRNKLQKEPGYASLESDCQQIERCIQIGLLCVNPERTKRPTMKKIIDMLQGLESMDLYITKELSSQDIMEEP